ncbi:antiporter, putative [Ricinus communis]|uniref:Antiporter, putative n=1 Tax=Ricinus communis TaxID=3988 RepID=B9T1W1_RICCO|nr:antiporter, putative [Ricinus communis]
MWASLWSQAISKTGSFNPNCNTLLKLGFYPCFYIMELFMGKILVFTGQDPTISHEAGLESLGAALAMCISYWLNVIILVLYMKYSSACDETCAPISMELFSGIGEFFRFAIPSAVMTCLSGDHLSCLSCSQGSCPIQSLRLLIETVSTLYAIPYGFVLHTRVSNELGGGNPQAARIAVYAVLFLGLVETTIVSSTLFASSRVFGYIFSNEKEVVDYVTTMSPLVCLSLIMSSLEAVLSGVARGCGWQHIGASVNLGAFYICGIPVAAILAFWLRLRGMGLWIGVQVGAFTQIVLLYIVTGYLNWEKQARKSEGNDF